MPTLTTERHQLPGTALDSVHGFVSDFQIGLENLGEQYGIYQAMIQTGPVTPTELAGILGLSITTVRIWLMTQAASKYIHYCQRADRYCLWRPIKRNRR